MRDARKTKAQLIEELEALRRNEKVVSGLLSGAHAVMECGRFEEAARSIFDTCRDLTGAAAGYVALLSADGAENEVLFLESGGLPCDVDPNLPMPVRGLRGEAYRGCVPVVGEKEMAYPVGWQTRPYVVRRIRREEE